MVYADYAYYTDTYCGNTLDGDEFARAAVRASSFLDYFTRGKAKDYEGDEIKMCCCALAEQYQVIEQATAQSVKGEVAGESVGSWSRTYRSGAEVSSAAHTALADIARQYLAHTGLLYRGGAPCVSAYGIGL
jgi:hypothetical protein